MKNAFDEAREELAKIAKEAAQRYPFIMQGLIGKEFALRGVTENFRNGGASQPFSARTAKNTSDKLRIAHGILYQSFAPGNQNNILTIEVRGSSVVVTYGTKVAYAAIHEYGGTIRHPGGTPYVVRQINGQVRAIFIRKDGNYPKGVKFTKAHPIQIKARSYFRKAQANFETKGAPQLQELVYERLQKIIG